MDYIRTSFVLIVVLLSALESVAQDTHVASVTPRYGSLNGHTLVTITGTGFAQNLFNHGPGNENLGNHVKFVSGTRSYECDILKDGCHETQVTCYTRAMVEGRYYVRVSVDGNAVSVDEHCRWEYDTRCSIVAAAGSTPYLSSVVPSSGPPGTILTIYGKIITSLYFSTGSAGTNGRTERIRRVYVGTQECDLLKEDTVDELYGIQLNNGGSSNHGWLKCKLTGNYIGNTNVSIIVEGSFGRSQPEPSTMSVSHSGQLHMYQSYAVLSDVSPKEGSVEGGTELTISGNYFDTRHPAKVTVGDAPCEVLSVTIDKIVVRTPPKPDNQTSFGGNRGVRLHQWHSGNVGYDHLPEVMDYPFNGSDYQSSWSDKAGYSEDSNSENANNYVTRFRGYYVPPETGEYQFHFLSDDVGQVYLSGSDKPEDKELILHCESNCYHYENVDTQISKRYTLQGEKRYYFEVVHGEYAGHGFVSLGVKMFKTHYTRYQSDSVDNEIQIIRIYSTPVFEKQGISIQNWATQTAVPEVQRIAVTMSNGSDPNQADIKFGFSDAYTVAVPLVSSAEDMKAALNDLISTFSESIDIQKDNLDIILTLPAGLGDVDDLDVMILPPGVATVSIVEETKGVPDLAELHLALDGVPAPAISHNAPAEEVESALWEMFSIRCPASISSSGEDPEGRRKLHLSFEDPEDLPSHEWGDVTYSSEPFCGRGCLKNPAYLYSVDLTALRLYMYPKMCFAYRGEFEPYFHADYTWTNSGDEDLSIRSNINVDLVSDGRWHYTCVDLQSLLEDAIEGPSSKHKLNSLQIYPLDDQSFVDELEYGVTDTIPSDIWEDIEESRLAPPMDVLMRNISVNKTGDSEYEVTLDPYHCAYNFPLFELQGSQIITDEDDSAVFGNAAWTSNMTLKVEKLVAASAPVMGTFSLSFKGQDIQDIPADIEAEELQALLRTLSGMGHVSVYTHGDCHGYGWTMHWVDIGDDQPLTLVNGTQLVGRDVLIRSWSHLDGGVLYKVIPGEFIQSYEETSQVVVHINNIPTACIDDCSFEWKEELTPTITSIDPTSGSLAASTVLTITGTGLEPLDDALDNSTVTIGGVPCGITSSTDTNILCDVGQGPLGSYDVEVKVGGKGLAAHASSRKQFTYTGLISSIDPAEGSNSGGLPLTITGSGFSNESSITVGGEDCPVLEYTYTTITCLLPAKASSASSTAAVVVDHPEGSLTSSDDFTYNIALTPMVTAISVTSSDVRGGKVLVISGSNLEPSGDNLLSVHIDTAEATVVNSSDTEISVILPPHKPGSLQVLVKLSDVGHADTETNSIPPIEYILSVNAVTPTEGSLMGGTRLTVQGDGFPTSMPDSELTVTVRHNVPCDVESTSTSQIVCMLESPGRNHDISNFGNHPVFGSGYAWKPAVLEVTAGDTVTWRWLVAEGVDHKAYAVIQTYGPSNTTAVEGGFNSGDKTPTGSYSKTLAVAGDYHYWSGPVDVNGDITMKGVVKVMPRSSSMETISVQVAGFDAEYNTASGVTISPSVDCHSNGETDGPDCTEDEVTDNSITDHFTFTLRNCLTPTIATVERSEMYVNEDVVITGTGFSVNPCENEVLIGDSPCIVSAATNTSLTCQMDLSGTPAVHILLPVTVRVENVGHAHWTTENMIDRSLVFHPYYATVSPSTGSLAGGTLVTINGAGFPDDPNNLEVTLGGDSGCTISHVTYTGIVCEAESGVEGTENVTVVQLVNGFGNELNCTDGPCSFEYSSAVTTVVTGLTPTSLAGLSNTITITGGFSALTEPNINITVGPNMCDIATKSDTEITCELTNLISGSHETSVRIDPSGLADIEVPTTITVQDSITSITPGTGSINGGTEVTIAGSVFDPASATVQIGDSECEVISVAYDAITCVTSDHAGGVVNVVVTTGDVTITGSGIYEYSQSSTPTVTSITPQSASTSGSVTLAGTGFSTTPADNVVSIGDYDCVPSSATDTLLVCAYQDLPAGVYNINLDVSGVGKATVVEDTVFQYDPTVSGISPNSGSFGGGHLVTVSGSGFDAREGTTSVLICDEPCDIVDVTLTEIQCLTAANDGSSNVDCDASVSVNNLIVSQSAAYTYDIAKTPVILGVSPSRGGTGGGTQITISGTDFGDTPTAITVTIADVACDVDTSQTTSTTVICVTNSISLTTKTKVRLQVNGQGIAPLQNADFEYIDLWSSVWTWGGESLPVEGDLVVIREGQTVLLDTDTPILKMLLIQGGSFIFDRKNVELNAEYILVTNGGLFQVGTEEEPFMDKATIKLHGHKRSQELPIYGAKTLAVREGTLDLHGRPTPVTWTHLASTAQVGDLQILLTTPVNWLPGDELVLASTGGRHSQRENEKKEIAAVSEDGLTLTLTDSLEYEHISVTETIDGEEIALRGEVGLLSHSITIQGSDDVQFHDDIPACPDGFDTGEFVTQTCFLGRFGDATDSSKFGGQIIMHKPNQSADSLIARIEHVELTFVGQEFRLGRYPIHFHLLGDMQDRAYVRGCGIHQTFNRAINVHGTHNLLIEHNVVYDVHGGALFLEDGIETGNIFQYNLAVFVKSSTSLLNDDITPAAFWVTNPNNTYRHNAAAGGTHFGFWYRMHEHPDGPSFTNTICPKKIPLGEFYNNSAHSLGWFGLWIFQDYFPTADGSCSSTTPIPAVYLNLTAWNCEKGAEWVDCANIQFDGFRMVNNEKAGIEMKKNKGLKFHEDGGKIKNSLIVGHSSASSSNECTTTGLILPFDSGLIVENVKFINFDKTCYAFGVAKIDGTCVELCGGWRSVTRGLEFYNTTNVVKWRWEHEAVIEDEDGSLTGTAGAKVVPQSNLLSGDQCVKQDRFSGPVIEGVQCDPSVNFVRLAFNHIQPPSLKFKNAILENRHGQSSVPYAFKRLTHKEGWMALLPSDEEYKLTFENALQITNISYDGIFYELRDSDNIVIVHNLTETPDHVNIKPGVTRTRSETVLSYSNNVDGDWTFDNDTKELSYLVSHKTESRRKRSGTAPSLMNSAVALQVHKCYYTDCIAPIDTGNTQLGRRPDVYYLWSELSTWELLGQDKPIAGDSVVIGKGYWVVANEPIPELDILYIEGVLEFEYLPKRPDTEDYYDFELSANYIFIKGGRFIIGWPDEPYRGQAEIILRGTHGSSVYRYDEAEGEEGPRIGSKGMAVFGSLDLHGIPHNVQWTHLTLTAEIGSDAITLDEAVDWEVGSDVVITTSSYDPWETETFRVEGKSGDSYTLTLNDTLKFKHLGERYAIPGIDPESTYKMAAQVGLLSRNIRIVGADYNDLYAESFGARVLVGTMADDDEEYTGNARLSNVEFYHTGQEGFTATYDPRFSLAFLDVGPVSDVRPSMVKSCSFHHGFATAVGIFGTSNLTAENNVIHHTVNHGIHVEGTGNRLIQNLISLVLWPGSYNGRNEKANFDQTAGIEATESVDLVMTSNVVAGAERIAYMIPGEPCDSLSSLYADNKAQGILTGVGIFPTYALSGDCILINGFTVQRAWDFGFYIQAEPNMKITNNLLVDNGVSVFTMTLKPTARSHVKVDKYVHLEDTVVIGNSPDLDCSTDVMSESNKILRLSEQARSFRTNTGGKVGIAFPTMQSGSNEAPRKTWIGIMAYPTIGGIMVVRRTHFAGFNADVCGGRPAIFSPSQGNDDGSHPVEVQSITYAESDVEQDSKVFIHRPNVKKVNPSDCVDMDCDGMKKSLLKDLDGSLFGSQGAVVPQSEWEWDGDARRGLGDYRIPKVMITGMDGSRLEVESFAPNKGIIRNQGCEYNTHWQAYWCPDANYEMLILESLDKDTEKRRVSPVAILGDGYLDLINGPQDHGWCDGYTCQERISTFMALVATDKHYDIYLSSTNPQKTRFYLLNTDADQAITIAVYYANPQRLDVYKNGVYVSPANSDLNDDGQIVYSEPSYESEYQPTFTQVSGTNYFDRESKMLYVTLKGPGPVDIVIAPIVVISFSVPAMTIDEFFGENLVGNLATFLGIDPSRIKVVNIVREESKKKKKRQSEGSVDLEISEPPILNLENGTDSAEMIQGNILNISSKIITEVQLGTLSGILNITLLRANVIEPMPSSDDPAWEEVSESLSEGTVTLTSIRIPSLLGAVSAGSEGVEGVGFDITPALKVTDELGDLVTQLGSISSPWQITARLVNGSGTDDRALLAGTLTMGFLFGYANFTDLTITHSGTGYMIEFEVTQPSEASFLRLSMGPFNINSRVLSARTMDLSRSVSIGQSFSITLELIDTWTEARPSDIHWKGHTWTCTIEKYDKTGYLGVYNVTEDTVSINETGLVTFSDLTLSEYGDVAFTFECVTSPDSEYSFVVHSNVISVTTHSLPIVEIMKEIRIVFEADFGEIVQDEEDIFSAGMKNLFRNKYPSEDLFMDNFTTSEGSIVVTFFIGGQTTAVDSAIESLWVDLENGLVFTYDNHSIQAKPYMEVDGEERWPADEEELDDSGGLHPAVIGVLGVVAVGLVLALILVLLLKGTKSGRSLLVRLKSDGRSEVSGSREIIVTDQAPPRRILYNDKSFSQHSSHSRSTLSPGYSDPLQFDSSSPTSSPSTGGSTPNSANLLLRSENSKGITSII